MVYLLNCSPTKCVKGKTPFDAWFSKMPGVQHLHTFGCVVHVKNTTTNLKKLDDCNRQMIFIGYEPGSKAYRGYNLVTKKVHVTRDIVFDEQAQWDRSAGGDRGEHDGDDTFTVEMEYSIVIQEEELVDAGPGSPDLAVAASPTPHALSPSPSSRGADEAGGQSVKLATHACSVGR
jgi:hypothetical protein